MSRQSLLRIGWRTLLRSPWQAALMILGITLGVAVVVAVDLANASASRAFELSTETVAGRATHQIVGGPQGLEEELYARLLQSGIVTASTPERRTGVAAPVVTDYVTSDRLGGRPLQLLGVDPFAETPFRDYLGRLGTGDPVIRGPAVDDLVVFLTRPGAVLVSSDMAERYGLRPCPQLSTEFPGCDLRLELGGRPAPAFIAGLLDPADRLSRQALDGLILADIATAQEITGRIGRLDRIDLILPPGKPQLIEDIEAILPEGVRLQPVEARSGTVQEMTAAFQINLSALSLLALVVGMFLIYNTMTFSVVQRRPLFGTLRCLGVTRREIFALVTVEALIAGLLGAGLGLALGVFMGQGAVRMVTQTINDLFFVVTVRGVQIPPASLVKGGLLGLLATLLTAAPPAWEAASVPPRAALSRSGLESKARRMVTLAAFAGAAMLAIGSVVLLMPSRSLVVSFAGTFAVIVGFAMLAPLATRLLMRLGAPVLGRVWGTLGRMAPRDVINSLSRTSIAVAALMVAVSVTIGVSLMVGSFRHTVVAWLEETLQGDVYISAPSLTANQSSASLDPQVVEIVRSWPGVARADVLRSVSVDSPVGPVNVAATDNTSLGQERLFVSTSVPEDEIWERLAGGAVIVSEPFANRLELPPRGASLTLNTDRGPQAFPVVGIYYDYASTQGTVAMALPVYRRLWDDPELTAVSVRLEPGVSPESVARAMQDELASRQNLLVRPNRVLREEVLVVFDRTFAITGALQLLATVVAFIGILSALLSLELERQRELGILRAIGLTVRQMWGLIMIETGLLGAVAGLLSMPTGYVLALILIYIINRRSFGWTLQMQADAGPFAQALAVAMAAALLAGVYPALRMGRMITSEALRSE